MVVIGILVTVLVTAIGSALSNARIAATKGTITKIHGMVQERIRAIDQATQGETFASAVRGTQRRFGIGSDLARVIVMKNAIKGAFPRPAANNISDVESSKLLYTALTQKEVFGVVPVDADTFNSNELQTDPADSRSYFVDAWGAPLRFYLWPTRLVRPGGAGTSPTPASGLLVDILIPGQNSALLLQDPDDPLDEFVGVFTNQNAAQLEASFHTPATYHVPLIVSAGPDRELGLYEPYHVDFDVNGNGSVETSNPSEDANGNGSHDNVLGWLAQPTPPALSNPGEGPAADNITNHQRAGRN